MLSAILAAALGPWLVASSPSSATAAAATDLLSVPPKDRPYQRYQWISADPKDRSEFLTLKRLTDNLLSTQAFFADAHPVSADVVRIDTRRLGWHKRLDVYEKFATLDFYFHVRAKLNDKRTIMVAWPGGDFAGKHYDAGVWPTEFAAGQSVVMAAPWISSVPLLNRDGIPVKVTDKKTGTQQTISAIDFLRLECLTEAPILDAHWFMIQTARQVSIRNVEEGAGYSDFLGIKKRDDMFRLAGIDDKLAIKVFQHWRDVVVRSGVSKQSRQVIAIGNRAWGTLDTFTQTDRGIPRRNLRPGEFAHDAEEWIFRIPNGLMGSALFDKNGNAQASAPDKIGGNTSPLNRSQDTRIHVNKACWDCHGIDRDCLKPVDGWARRAFRQGGVLRLQDKDVEVLTELQGQYLRDMEILLDDDRRLFARAVSQVTAPPPVKPGARPGPGLTVPQITRLYAKWWDRYVEEDVTPEVAARELGVTPAKWIAQLQLYQKAAGKEDLVLADHLDHPPVPIPRLDWESSYAFAQVIALGLYPPEEIKKVKVFP